MEYKEYSYSELVKEENKLRKKYDEIENDCAKKAFLMRNFAINQEM